MVLLFQLHRNIVPVVAPLLAAARIWFATQFSAGLVPLLDIALLLVLLCAAIVFWCEMVSTVRAISVQLMLCVLWACTATVLTQLVLLAAESAIDNNPQWTAAVRAALTDRAFALLNSTLSTLQ